MGKFLKPGKVVIVLNGRYAGKKAVIVKANDDGTSERPYGHALVAGVAKYPLRVKKSMGKKKQARRSRVKPFLRVVNFNHLMPTRYALDVAVPKEVVNAAALKDRSLKVKAYREVKSRFEERYKTGKNRWFFSNLRF
ncbi:large ribosomal subunit protein eL27-like [Sycon ciliatum]|uniref:large ribosomal subunit protein eL27-like n=1 Tax=Sycon ciliatum TaxID=27933 RepID=UPI0031F66CCE